MPKQLTVHNATITTASVQVKTLTISGKQVTLAVFRQLREEQLVADDGTLNGVPWGYVNYHPDKCESGNPHLHVVWQNGDDLLRARVDTKPGFEWKGSDGHAHVPVEASQYLASQVREWMHGRTDDCPVDIDESGRSRFGRRAEGQPMGSPYGFPVWAKVTPSMARAIDAKEEADASERLLEGMLESGMRYGMPVTPEHIAERRADTAKALEGFADVRTAMDAEIGQLGLSHGQLAEAMNAAVHAEHLRRQRHRDVRTALADLPQLFIAV
jgi:hypothetical protein